MHAPQTLPETETPEVLPSTSKVIKTVMAALVAMGIYDIYQDSKSDPQENTVPSIQTQP